MKLAAQLFTIREFTQTPEDIRASLKKIREIGYEAVQVSGFGPIDPHELKEYLDENGLELCVTHVPFDRIVNDTDALIAEHKLWNCKYIGLGAKPWDMPNTKEGFDTMLAALAPAVEKIYDSGMKFLYHNHRFEFVKIDGKMNGMEYLAEKTDPDKFGFLADFYWVQAGGASPTQFIEKYANRLQVTHFKDMVALDHDTVTMAEIFEGNMDYQAIYDACVKNGVEWAAIEQDECTGDPFESLKISFDNCKAHNMFAK